MRRIVVLGMAAALTFSMVNASPVLAAPASPVIYAHRGGAGYAPENTLAAFRKTEALYGDRNVWLEMDTQATKDNVLVVMHDDTVNRTTDCTGAVNARTYAALSSCNAAANYPGGWPEPVPIPTMEQVLTEGRDNGWKLMVEIKDIPLESNFDPVGNQVAQLLIPLIRRTGFPIQNLIIQSFFPTVLTNVHLLNSHIKTLFLTSSTLPSAPQGVGIPALLNVIYCALNNVTIAAPDVATIDFSKTTVQLAHSLKRKVIPWTIDDAPTLLKMRAWGVDGVITNRPDLAVATYT